MPLVQTEIHAGVATVTLADAERRNALTLPMVNKLAEWLAEFQAEQWDRQIEEDDRAGRLDKFIEEAKAELAAGKARPL